MQNNPLAVIAIILVSIYVIKLWLDDLRAMRSGKPHPKALPGATPTSWTAVGIAALGATLILAGETIGEIQLGLAEQQSNMTVLFAAYTLCAAVVEEIVFRGYIVVENRGTAVKWMAVLGASILFAALHPFLWDWREGRILWTLGAKGWFSTVVVLLSSVWFYTVRFARFNPSGSLLPCFAAHLTKNVGVIAIKAIQGHLIGLY
ncbi:CPBP family intramembrane metalloprotease [Opitutaceae bacterium EW11]|nr:CPBP family intramembrane metalloprotease [Opitutaceae bacterium EW11]